VCLGTQQIHQEWGGGGGGACNCVLQNICSEAKLPSTREGPSEKRVSNSSIMLHKATPPMAQTAKLKYHVTWQMGVAFIRE
jgi:hypothetical protein